MAVSDAGQVMPPKSTWFEPKLRSGLFVHELSEVRVDPERSEGSCRPARSLAPLG